MKISNYVVTVRGLPIKYDDGRVEYLPKKIVVAKNLDDLMIIMLAEITILSSLTDMYQACSMVRGEYRSFWCRLFNRKYYDRSVIWSKNFGEFLVMKQKNIL